MILASLIRTGEQEQLQNPVNWQPAGIPEFQASYQLDWTLAQQQFGQQHYVSDYKQLLTGHAGFWQNSMFGYGGPPLGPSAYGGPATTPYPDRYNNQVINCG